MAPYPFQRSHTELSNELQCFHLTAIHFCAKPIIHNLIYLINHGVLKRNPTPSIFFLCSEPLLAILNKPASLAFLFLSASLRLFVLSSCLFQVHFLQNLFFVFLFDASCLQLTPASIFHFHVEVRFFFQNSVQTILAFLKPLKTLPQSALIPHYYSLVWVPCR